MKLSASPDDQKSNHNGAQLSVNDLLNMMKVSKPSRRKSSSQAAKLVKSIFCKLTLMQQQALESIWTQLSPWGQDVVAYFLQRLWECNNDDERRIVLERMQSEIVLDNRTLEGSAVLHLCMQEISLAALNPVVEAEGLVVEAEGVGREADGIVDEAEGLVVEVEGVGGGADGIVDKAEGNEAVTLLLNASMETFSASSSNDEDSNATSESSLEEEFALDNNRHFL